MCSRLLVDSLFKYSESMAAVVDTTGNFDVVQLYTRILERVRKDNSAKGKEEDVAAKILDQVKIMRVFDFVGMREAIGEIRDDLEGRKRTGWKKQEGRGYTRPSTPKRPTPEPLTPEMPKRTVVADSEDEDDDEEMLFDTAEPVETTLPIPGPEQSKPSPQPEPKAITEQQAQPPSKVKFILIDNLTQVLTPLLKKDFIQGNPSPPFPHPHANHIHFSKRPIINIPPNPRPPHPHPRAPHHPLESRHITTPCITCASATRFRTAQTTASPAAFDFHE
jgi:hypothetical protein